MKRVLSIIAVGIALGIVLFILKNALDIDDSAFWRYYFTGGIAAITAAALWNLLYTGRYQRKMKEAAALRGKGDTAGYMAAIEKLLQTAKGRQLKSQLKLNLSAGYCDLEQYEQAIAILEPLGQEKLRGPIRLVQRLNLCICYFYSGKTDKALALYHNSQKLFAPYRRTPVYGGNLAVLEMLADIEEGEYPKAAELLRQARSSWNIPRLYDDYQYVEHRLRERFPGFDMLDDGEEPDDLEDWETPGEPDAPAAPEDREP